MAQKKGERKARVGDIYVVTNDCFVKVRSRLARKMVRPVKIGRAKDCVIRVGNMSSSVFDDFTYHLVLRAQDVVRCEDDIHDLVKDYRILTKKSGGKTEFFDCPLEEVFARIKKYVAKNPDLIRITEDNGIKGRSTGRSAVAQKSMRRKQAEAKAQRRTKAVKTKLAAKIKSGGTGTWTNLSQFAELVARRAGSEGVGVDFLRLILSGRKIKSGKPCRPGTKWRKPLEDAGVKFDKDDFVTDWQHAKNPL